jgi:putative transcriptional regulator
MMEIRAPMSDTFKSIESGLKEAIAHARGEGPTTVHEIEIPDPDVRVIRSQTGLSQAEFARSIGVKKATLLNWELRRRKPDGPARVLLALIAQNPEIIQRLLSPGN